jgi:N-acetylglucosamine kinase-like BadF-type ATPase
LNGRIAAAGAANDAVSLLLGLDADGIIVAGTGSIVIIRSRDGGLYQVGGQEWVACDDGSGFWIGLRSIRQAYRDLEAGVDSVLLQRLRQLYGIRPDDDRRLIARLRDLSIADSNMKKEIARFAASVCAAAERGDAAAQNIVKAEAEELADVTAGALRRRYSLSELNAGVGLVQCGSVLGNEFYRASFEAQLEMRLRSGVDQRAELRWRRVTTADEAAINLARSLRDSTEGMLALDLAYRPAVVRFS